MQIMSFSQWKANNLVFNNTISDTLSSLIKIVLKFISFSDCFAVSISFLNRNQLRRIPYRAFYNVTHLDILWVFLTVIS